MILLFWGFLLGALYGMVAGSFGGAYLFLEPEYLGAENFWSSLIVGSALGAFLFAYMITIFINVSYRFQFIALTAHPFYTFAYNNFIIPLIFLGLYVYRYVNFHLENYGGFDWMVVEKLAGLLTGMGVVFLMSASYFFARKTLIQRFGQHLQWHIHLRKQAHDKKVILDKARKSYQAGQLADSYLQFPFRIQRVEETASLSFRKLVHTLSQHHGKLLMMQILMFLMVAGLGLLEDDPVFQIPMGASILLILSLVLMMAGAITFWFRKLGLLAFFALLVFGYVYDRSDLFHEKHYAFGMNYEVPPAAYTHACLDSLTRESNYEIDRRQTLEALNSWKARYQAAYGPYSKPKAVFVSASGGGLRSAVWTLLVLQHADSLTRGALREHIRLMTGASGGMFGLAYFRELQLRQLKGEISQLYSKTYTDNISKDLLNRISFKYFADVFLPNRSIRIDGRKYDREVGYSFDHQLALNLPEFQNRKLGHYREAELQGLVPTVIITPSILNQGRKLYISASPVSFLSKAGNITDHYISKVPGVEFRRMFEKQHADSLWMTTALRMNATFPYILPIIQLPSSPPMAVMDAGAMDNYGTQTAIKYLFEFKEWFAENTESVIFIQIRDNDREDPITDLSAQDYFSQMMSPLGGGYYSITESRDLANEYLLRFAKEWYPGQMEVITFEYPRETSSEPASLSFHLTQREKRNIYNSLNTPNNQKSFSLVRQLYRPELLARGEKIPAYQEGGSR